jgi:hypothetical protein
MILLKACYLFFVQNASGADHAFPRNACEAYRDPSFSGKLVSIGDTSLLIIPVSHNRNVIIGVALTKHRSGEGGFESDDVGMLNVIGQCQTSLDQSEQLRALMELGRTQTVETTVNSHSHLFHLMRFSLLHTLRFGMEDAGLQMVGNDAACLVIQGPEQVQLEDGGSFVADRTTSKEFDDRRASAQIWTDGSDEKNTACGRL